MSLAPFDPNKIMKHFLLKQIWRLFFQLVYLKQSLLNGDWHHVFFIMCEFHNCLSKMIPTWTAWFIGLQISLHHFDQPNDEMRRSWGRQYQWQTYESDVFESNMTIFIYQMIKNTHNKLNFIQFGTQLSFELDKLKSSTNQGSMDRQ